VEQEPHSSLRRSASGRLPELVRQVFQVDLADLDVLGAGDAEDRRPGNLAAEDRPENERLPTIFSPPTSRSPIRSAS
jgi:hypothetical protein